jgi:radical SAM superfamily enzyme YgiQ (UPF0313 family)
MNICVFYLTFLNKLEIFKIMHKTKVFMMSISTSYFDWLPYAVGSLISYVKSDTVIENNFEFLDPEYRYKCMEIESFHDNLKSADIIGLTNWIWNQNLNDRIAKLFKTYNKNGLVIYGGTNVPEDQQLAKEYAANRPFVDLFFPGPAEKSFKNFLLNYCNNDSLTVNGTFTKDTFNFKRESYKGMVLPSPYTSGVFDNLILNSEEKLGAVLETNRGCPYSCAFCDWGGLTNSKIMKHEYQQNLDNIAFIAKHEIIDKVDLIDANFGIFPEDLDYIKFLISEKNKRKTDIRLFMGGLAKNGSKNLEEIMNLINTNFNGHHVGNSVKLSFQSHNPEVLKSINRSNIDNSKLFPMADRLSKSGILTDAEMIIGLPGETVEGWIDTIQKNVDLRVDTQRTYFLHFMVNTPMYSEEYRKKYKIKTKKVLIPEILNNYTLQEYHKSRFSKKIVSDCKFDDLLEYQTLEFMYECSSFDSQELLEMFKVWGWFDALYNSNLAKREMIIGDKTIKEQYQLFNKLMTDDKMPFFKKIFDEYSDLVWNLVKPEPITAVNDLATANFINKFFLRGNMVVDLVTNKDVALNELSQVYPKINFDHLKYKELPRLYVMGGQV